MDDALRVRAAERTRKSLPDGEACYRVTFTARDGSALHAFVRTR
jgi:hypothetical protein